MPSYCVTYRIKLVLVISPESQPVNDSFILCANENSSLVNFNSLCRLKADFVDLKTKGRLSWYTDIVAVLFCF